MIRAVAWDVDGTLVDSEPLHLRALLAVCADHGVDVSDYPDDRFIGTNLPGVWDVLKPRFPRTLKRADWIAQINRFNQAHAGDLEPIPFAVEVVRELRALGVEQVAVSNSSRVVVDSNLAAIGVDGAMAFSISLDDVPIGKPDPTPYNMATERLGLRPREILAVEDSASGLQSARGAGMVVASLGCHSTAHTLADIALRSLRDILELPIVGKTHGLQD